MKDIPITMFCLLRPTSLYGVGRFRGARWYGGYRRHTTDHHNPDHRPCQGGGFVLNRLTDINVS